MRVTLCQKQLVDINCCISEGEKPCWSVSLCHYINGKLKFCSCRWHPNASLVWDYMNLVPQAFFLVLAPPSEKKPNTKTIFLLARVVFCEETLHTFQFITAHWHHSVCTSRSSDRIQSTFTETKYIMKKCITGAMPFGLFLEFLTS